MNTCTKISYNSCGGTIAMRTKRDAILFSYGRFCIIYGVNNIAPNNVVESKTLWNPLPNFAIFVTCSLKLMSLTKSFGHLP